MDDYFYRLARKLVGAVVTQKNEECLVPKNFWKNQGIYSQRLGRVLAPTDDLLRNAFRELQKNMVVKFRTTTMTTSSGSEIPAYGITVFHWDERNQRLATDNSQKQDSGV